MNLERNIIKKKH